MVKILKEMWKERTAYLQILPCLLLLVFIAFGPVAFGIIVGLTDFNILHLSEMSFVGLRNFFDHLLNPHYHFILRNTLYYTVFVTGFAYIGGLGLALMLNARRLKAKKFFRLLVLIPWVITPVVVAIIWSILMRAQYGLINAMLIKWGFSTINFLGDPNHTLEYIMIPQVWRALPFAALILFARLRGIPREHYEVASLDGASRSQQFLYVTLPELRKVSEILLLFMVLMNAKVFDIIWVLTMGGPANSTQVSMTYVYDLAFQRWNIGSAAAATYVPMSILFLIGFFYIRLRERKEE